MTHRLRNWSFSQPPLSDGDEIVNCNLQQFAPNTPIATGVTGLIFRDCNLVNCLLPEGSVAIGCNMTQIDRCSRNWPSVAAEPCGEDCRHAVITEIIGSGGVVIATSTRYEDMLL